MKIGLHSADRINFPNLPLMKLATYWKRKGIKITWYDAIFNNCDAVYSSKIFDFTPEDLYLPPDTIKGGTGYDLITNLPSAVENSQPDYSIYPFCDYSIQLFSRGCIRSCKFCVVPQKEGKIRAIDPMNLNSQGCHIEILDNNFFANPNWKDAIQYLKTKNQPVNFHGIDARILTSEQAFSLNELKHKKQIKIAWDDPLLDLTDCLKKITKWIRPSVLMCYVLIGYDSNEEQDLYRIEKLRELKIDPFVMPFNKHDDYQKKMARWVNHKAIFYSVKWKDYEP